MPSPPTRKILLVSDVHWAVRDRAAWSLFEGFRQIYKPDEIHCLGDMVDFAPVGRFADFTYDEAGNPIPTPEDELEQEILGVKKAFARWRKDHPDAVLTYTAGNHEARLSKYLLSNAKALAGLKVFGLPALFELPEQRISFLPYGAGRDVYGCWLTHGTRSTATAELNLWRRPGISGHLHRSLYASYRGADMRMVEWQVLPCLAKLNPQWSPINGWHHGWGVLEWHAAEQRLVREIVPVENGRVVWRDMTLECEPEPAPHP